MNNRDRIIHMIHQEQINLYNISRVPGTRTKLGVEIGRNYMSLKTVKDNGGEHDYSNFVTH